MLERVAMGLTRNGSEPDQTSQCGNEDPSASNGGSVELGKRLPNTLPSTESSPSGSGSTVDDLPVTSNSEREPDAGGVDEEGKSQVGCKTVLRDTGHATELLDLGLVESRLDHVPSHATLATDEGSNTEEG